MKYPALTVQYMVDPRLARELLEMRAEVAVRTAEEFRYAFARNPDQLYTGAELAEMFAWAAAEARQALKAGS